MVKLSFTNRKKGKKDVIYHKENGIQQIKNKTNKQA